MRHRPTKKRLVAILALLICLALAATNWLVHQPRNWQQTQSARVTPSIAAWIARIGHATADFTDALGVTGSDVTAPLATQLHTNLLVCAGLPVRANENAPNDIIVLNRKGFIVGYSPTLRQPVWVAYRTYPVHGYELPPRPSGFKTDPEARNASQHKDYAKTGYDRGHMVPNLAIASRYGKEGQAQTFLTSNICPQRPSLNQGPWRDLEFRLSEIWPNRYGAVWVIAGAVTTPNPKRLPSGIAIPTAFYQIVVTQDAKRLRTFAVYMPQTLRRRDYVRATLVSIDELEQMTGFDFLAALPDEIEAVLEAATPTRLWPTGVPGLIRLMRERFRTYP